MKEKDMVKIAFWIKEVLDSIKHYRLPHDKEERKKYLDNFKKELHKNKTLPKINREIRKFCIKYPVPGIR
jgi:glycine/serine hydroxymethyltransferase